MHCESKMRWKNILQLHFFILFFNMHWKMFEHDMYRIPSQKKTKSDRWQTVHTEVTSIFRFPPGLNTILVHLPNTSRIHRESQDFPDKTNFHSTSDLRSSADSYPLVTRRYLRKSAWSNSFISGDYPRSRPQHHSIPPRWSYSILGYKKNTFC